MGIFETIAEIFGYIIGPVTMLPRIIAQQITDKTFIIGKVINKFSPMISAPVALALVGCLGMFLAMGTIKWLWGMATAMMRTCVVLSVKILVL